MDKHQTGEIFDFCSAMARFQFGSDAAEEVLEADQKEAKRLQNLKKAQILRKKLPDLKDELDLAETDVRTLKQRIQEIETEIRALEKDEGNNL